MEYLTLWNYQCTQCPNPLPTSYPNILYNALICETTFQNNIIIVYFVTKTHASILLNSNSQVELYVVYKIFKG